MVTSRPKSKCLTPCSYLGIVFKLQWRHFQAAPFSPWFLFSLRCQVLTIDRSALILPHKPHPLLLLITQHSLALSWPEQSSLVPGLVPTALGPPYFWLPMPLPLQGCPPFPLFQPLSLFFSNSNPPFFEPSLPSAHLLAHFHNFSHPCFTSLPTLPDQPHPQFCTWIDLVRPFALSSHHPGL